MFAWVQILQGVSLTKYSSAGEKYSSAGEGDERLHACDGCWQLDATPINPKHAPPHILHTSSCCYVHIMPYHASFTKVHLIVAYDAK